MATKENVAQHVAGLMSNQENIRNIGIIAHVDHGKCVAPESKILLTDGQIIKASDLYDNLSQNSQPIKKNKNETVFDVSDKNTITYSLNKGTGKIEKKPIQYAWKLAGGEVLEVELRNGMKIKTTPEHKYLAFNGNDFIEKEAKFLSKGDFIVSARSLNVESSIDIKAEIIQLLSKSISKECFYIRLNKQASEEVKKLVKELGVERVREELGVSKPAFQADLQEGRFLIKHAAQLADLFNIPYSILYDRIETIFYRRGGKFSKNSKKMRLPQDFKSFFYLTGLLFGDGSGKTFTVGKPELAKEFRNACSLLGINTTSIEREGIERIDSGCKTLVEILKILFDYPTIKKSHNITLSPFLTKANDDYTACFLKAYFDCDGTVEKSRGAISLTSVSGEILEQTQLLLLRFGCQSILQRDTLYISGNSAKNFVEKIGFNVTEKMRKAKELALNATGSYALDLIPLSRASLKQAIGASSMSSISNNYYEYVNGKVKPTRASLQKLSLANFDKFISNDIAFIEVKKITKSFEKEVFDFTIPDNHNFVSQGMIIHNSTLSDSLVAKAGLISKALAGEQRVLDFELLEQQRGITIKAANISIPLNHKGKDYLINLIDTPGHVDFGGHVTRALRAVDGAVLVVDCVEGIMPQTETVLRQALREKVKPVLFINKIDRFITELKLDSNAMQKKFLKIITGVNKLINDFASDEFKEKWQIKVESGNVAFGSAFNKWAISYAVMKEKNISFKQMYDLCQKGDHAKLQEIAPLDDVIIEMIISQMPNPLQAQKYRIPVIWHGDPESEIGKSMINCDSKGELTFGVTAIQTDPHAGEVAVGRLYSGVLKKGEEVYLSSHYKKEKVQQVAIYMGPDRVVLDQASAGNIVALVGLKDVTAGETISFNEITPFEQIKHHSEPVITKSIEAKNPKDLVRLIEVLHKFAKEDPTLRVEINQNTGEHLLSGMGELHLEIIEIKIKDEKGIEIVTSQPIVVYHETITGKGPTLEGKSPNKHNKFKVSVEPLEEGVVKAFEDGEIDDKMKGKDLQERLIKAGLPRPEGRKVLDVFDGNIFVDVTKGVQGLQDVMELLIDGFEEAMKEGPLAKENVVGVKVKLEDASIHVDPAHRGPSQIIPAIKRPLYAGMLYSNCVLLEPKQKLVVTCPSDYMSGVIGQIQSRRGQITSIEQEGELVIINAKVPVSEMFGFSSEVRSASQGRAAWYTEYAGYEKLPIDLQNQIILSIRKRKGEPEQLPTVSTFID